MELSINSHNMELTPRLQTYIEKKTSRLDRYMPTLTEVRVDLSTQNSRNANERQVAQITIRDRRGTILRAEERHSDMFAAIDEVVDKIYRRIQRYQGKRRRRWRTGANEEEFIEGEPLPVEVEEEEEETSKIVRYKRFSLQPMSPDEAIEQMELLGHDFFVFFNADDEAVNVLYRRRDGNYGLLQPEFD
ncbi:MAG: ribosome-associated translation inhibitor RaiA [Chloroflexi bacterium]|nr:MAG: ribosome-associated translation inhibitor RaiA [Chloroflexota bacterium]